jgi:hypothetical protein
VPHVRQSVHGPKKTGAQPLQTLLLGGQKIATRGRILGHKVKAFEKFRFRLMYALANTPNFLHAALDKSVVRLSFKERRMKFMEPIGFDRKIRGHGAPVQNL